MEMNPIKSSSSDLLPPHMLELNNKNWWFINLVVCLLLHSLILFFPLSEWRCSDLSSSLVNLFEKSRIAVPLKCDLSFCSDLVSAALFFKGNTFHLTSGIWQDLLHPLFPFSISLSPWHFFFFLLCFQKEDWPMHKLECASMCTFGQNWQPSETVRLTARILAKQVSRRWGLGCLLLLWVPGKAGKWKLTNSHCPCKAHTHTSPVYRQV